MPDQADHLRHLMHDAQGERQDGAAPRLLVVAGAKGGVGTTTIAVRLAATLARLGQATALVDGDFGKAGVAGCCGLTGGPTILDVLSGRRHVEEALQPGPSGARLLAGAWATGRLTDCDAACQQRLIAQLKGLRETDVVIIDGGCGQHRILERFWGAADDVLLVATPEDAAVMDAYSTVKTMAGRHRGVPIHVVMNQVRRYDAARGAYARLQNACRRFLAVEVPCVANILFTANVPVASGQGDADSLSRWQTAVSRRQREQSVAQVSQYTQSIEQLARLFGIVHGRAVHLRKAIQNSEQTVQAPAAAQPIISPGVGRVSVGNL